MKQALFFLACILLISQISQSAVSFVTQPALTKESSTRWVLTFAVDQAADVAVSIINVRDSVIIRNLAAGKLGSNAPAPLVKDSLRQVLIWDGNDNLGRPVTVADSDIRARVRAGIGSQLVDLVGDNPNTFGNAIAGIVTGKDGSMYVCGMPGHLWQQHYMTPYLVVRKYDKNGNYVKTVFPPPANLPQTQVKGWGTVNRPDGGFLLKSSITSIPSLSTTILSSFQQPDGSSLIMMDTSGRLVFGSHNAFLAFGTDGSLPDSAAAPQMVKSPAMANKYLGPLYSQTLGYAFVTPIPNSDSVFLSGIFHCVGASNQVTIAPDTNYYRDGKVYKVCLSTGNVQTFITLDSIPQVPASRQAILGSRAIEGAIGGTALDASGRLYVCDRFHKCVNVYDADATLLRQIPVMYPERVAVSAKTGALFVLTRLEQSTSVGHVRLFKFAPFDQGSAKICSVSVFAGVSRLSSLAINDSSAQTRIWAGASSASVKIYEDAGASLSLFKDWEAEGKGLLKEYDRLAIDRNSGTVYISDYQWGLYKIENWLTPKAVPCSTTTGRLWGTDLAVSPSGYLYVHEGSNQNFRPALKRYSLDHIHRPVNWANSGNNVLSPQNAQNNYFKWGGGTGERGLAVAPDGHVASMGGGTPYRVYTYADSGHDIARPYDKVQIYPLPNSCGGVKFDPQGNLYVGAVIRTAEHQVYTGFLGDRTYNTAVGSIVKFNGSDSGSISATAAANAAIVYSTAGLSPFSLDPMGGGCLCHSPRFDVDPYGRLFVPNAITNQVSLLDNNGNLILQFGKYGNTDSRGGLSGPGTLVPGTEIPLLWPSSAVASEDWIYVSDFANCRLARIKMTYAIDNHPGFSARGSALEEAATIRNPSVYGLTSFPLPFRTSTTVTAVLPAYSNVRLDVFDARGRHVKTLGKGMLAAGLHKFAWDGTDRLNQPAAAGAYFYKLTAGSRMMISRTVLTK